MEHHKFKSLKAWKKQVIVPRVVATLASSLFLLVVMAAIFFQTAQNTSQKKNIVNTQASAACNDLAGGCTDNAACDGQQGRWCNQSFLRCENNKPIARNLQCVPDGNDGNKLKWKFLGEGPTSCNFYSDSCGGNAPDAPSGGVSCTGRPFALIFKTPKAPVAGQSITCNVKSTAQGCTPCKGLKLATGCTINAGETSCSTAETDCVCNPHEYQCTVNNPGQPQANAADVQLASAAVNVLGESNTALANGEASCANDSSCDKPIPPPPPPPNNPPPNNPPPPPDNKCVPDQTTCGSACGAGGVGKCDQCGGGWCKGGTCNSCSPEAPPPPTCQEGKTSCSCPSGTSCGTCNSGTCENNVCKTCSPPKANPTPVQPIEIVDKPAATSISKKAKNGSALAQNFTCLKSEPCSGTSCPGVTQADHAVKLSTKDDVKPDASADSWIFECINTVSGRRCTSGNSQIDLDTLGEDNVTYLKGNVGYRFGQFLPTNGSRNQNPIKIGSSKSVGFWESFTAKHVGRVFLAMNQFEPGSSNGGLGGQHQAGLLFDSPDKKCIQIFWDPYGTVFDADTLKPVSGAVITLYKKEHGKYSLVTRMDVLSAIQNPYTTKADGSYRFLLPDGTYKMEVKANGYTMVKEVTNPGEYVNVYQGGDIIQVGGPKRFDIAVQRP